MTGTVTRQLLSGPHEDKMALLEFQDWRFLGASDAETKEEFNPDEIAAADIEKAIEFLTTSEIYQGIKDEYEY